MNALCGDSAQSPELKARKILCMTFCRQSKKFHGQLINNAGNCVLLVHNIASSGAFLKIAAIMPLFWIFASVSRQSPGSMLIPGNQAQYAAMRCTSTHKPTDRGKGCSTNATGTLVADSCISEGFVAMSWLFRECRLRALPQALDGEHVALRRGFLVPPKGFLDIRCNPGSFFVTTDEGKLGGRVASATPRSSASDFWRSASVFAVHRRSTLS